MTAANMSDWTKERLDRMIAEGIEESLTLDYKRAASLENTDGRKAEITKDVSSFANSSGGVVIYGIAEFGDDARRHLPERLDPFRRDDISREWLAQVIQTIQPRIEGLAIHPVTISESANTVCYVVEIPQSHTAHMARDHRYYKRHHFGSLAMEDYEVRDVMNRRTHPRIRASIFINRITSRVDPDGAILVKLENVGRTLAKHVMAELEIPVDLNGLISVDEPATMNHDEDGDYFLTKLTTGLYATPIFPGSSLTLRRKIKTHVTIQHLDGRPLNPRRYIKVSVFADEMPPLCAKLKIALVLAGWTPVQDRTQ
jgi:hypothetical protein